MSMEWRSNTNEVTTVNVVDTLKNEVEVIDTYQTDPIKNGENSVKLVRGPRGRFVVGNRESVGNKGGRPRDLTWGDIEKGIVNIDEVFQKSIDGDVRSIKALLNLFDGKLK